MKKELLKTYINKLTKQDIINYINKENVEATPEEIDIIYNTIKNEYEVILETNFMNYFSNYKFILNEKLYKYEIENIRNKKFIDFIQ